LAAWARGRRISRDALVNLLVAVSVFVVCWGADLRQIELPLPP